MRLRSTGDVRAARPAILGIAASAASAGACAWIWASVGAVGATSSPAGVPAGARPAPP